MTTSGRSSATAYLAMGAVVLTTVVALNAISTPGPPPEPAIHPGPTVSIVDGFGSTIERDFLPTVLRRPRISRAHRYCDPRGCCPTSRTVLGTTSNVDVVIATLESQGYEARPWHGEAMRAGPFPKAGWTGVLGAGDRRTWLRVDVSRGADVDRPAWPTIFVHSSVACPTR
ncbi:MAG TPA: hypothetical protein VG993_11570 [Actinomycetota bacterium]|jgi:hypothetical protein|nr:hypothetical protein [Actinomycetota bacterium]